jgi:hypothetical protein
VQRPDTAAGFSLPRNHNVHQTAGFTSGEAEDEKNGTLVFQGPILNPEDLWSVVLFFLKFIPRIVDEFEENPIDIFRMNEGKLAASKRSQSTNELVTFCL